MDDKTTFSDIKDHKIYAFLSYLSAFCIIPLILKKNNPFVLRHGKQGLILFVTETAVFVLHIIVGVWFLKLGIFIAGLCSLAGMIAVLQGRSLEMPLITTLAKKITL